MRERVSETDRERRGKIEGFVKGEGGGDGGR